MILASLSYDYDYGFKNILVSLSYDDDYCFRNILASLSNDDDYCQMIRCISLMMLKFIIRCFEQFCPGQCGHDVPLTTKLLLLLPPDEDLDSRLPSVPF